MRKAFLFLTLALLSVLILSSAAYSQQDLDQMKAQLKAQVRREMGLSEAPSGPVRQSVQMTPKTSRKKTFDIDLSDIDIETALQWVIIMMFMGFIPATIAHFKGRNFFLWWLLGVAFFIIALPVIIFLKKKEKRPARAGKGSDKEGPEASKKPDKPEQGPKAPPEKEQTAGASPGKPSALDIYDQIEKLSELKARGVITQEEFRVKKRELLDRI